MSHSPNHLTWALLLPPKHLPQHCVLPSYHGMLQNAAPVHHLQPWWYPIYNQPLCVVSEMFLLLLWQVICICGCCPVVVVVCGVDIGKWKCRHRKKSKCEIIHPNLTVVNPLSLKKFPQFWLYITILSTNDMWKMKEGDVPRGPLSKPKCHEVFSFTVETNQ